MVAVNRKIFNWIGNYKKKIISKIKHENKANDLVFKDCLKENTKRILYTSFFEMILHLGVIILFIYNLLTRSIINHNWQMSIIICHFIFLIISSIAFIMAIRTFHRGFKNVMLAKYMQLLYFILLLIMGIILSAVDQISSQGIVPFIIVSLSVGSFFLIKPINSFILYFIAYAIFATMMELVISGNTKLITCFANGFAMVIIGYTVSLIGWSNHRTNINQKKEIARQQEMLEKMAYIDSLTNIPNRRFFDKIIEKEKAKIRRKKITSTLAIIDIDYFKSINDIYGHSTGDIVLREIADTINSNIRKTDTVARLGGEEFIILFPDTSVNDSYKIIEELRQIIMKKNIIVDGKKINVTASFGVSNLRDDDKVYYANADQALYLAKNSGRNKIVKHNSKKNIKISSLNSVECKEV